jgi:hypothetical protein
MWQDFLVSAAPTGTRPYDLQLRRLLLVPLPLAGAAERRVREHVRGATATVQRTRNAHRLSVAHAPARLPGRRRFQRPWVYLHALAGYTDMAAALEGEPAARAVVNFTPVLLDQLDDYARRLKRWRDTGTPPRDPLVDALIRLPPPGPGRAELVRTCLYSAESCARNSASKSATDGAGLCAPGHQNQSEPSQAPSRCRSARSERPLQSSASLAAISSSQARFFSGCPSR